MKENEIGNLREQKEKFQEKRNELISYIDEIKNPFLDKGAENLPLLEDEIKKKAGEFDTKIRFKIFVADNSVFIMVQQNFDPNILDEDFKYLGTVEEEDFYIFSENMLLVISEEGHETYQITKDNLKNNEVEHERFFLPFWFARLQNHL